MGYNNLDASALICDHLRNPELKVDPWLGDTFRHS
jgi:hypothetical protein